LRRVDAAQIVWAYLAVATKVLVSGSVVVSHRILPGIPFGLVLKVLLRMTTVHGLFSLLATTWSGAARLLQRSHPGTSPWKPRLLIDRSDTGGLWLFVDVDAGPLLAAFWLLARRTSDVALAFRTDVVSSVQVFNQILARTGDGSHRVEDAPKGGVLAGENLAASDVPADQVPAGILDEFLTHGSRESAAVRIVAQEKEG
jgi:hypothetical protein